MQGAWELNESKEIGNFSWVINMWFCQFDHVMYALN